MSIQTIGPLRIVHFIVVSDVEDHAIKWSFSVCVNFKGDQSEVSRQKKGKSGGMPPPPTGKILDV